MIADEVFPREQSMKINPYKLIEYILFGLVMAAGLTFFCVVITAMEWWREVGIAVTVFVGVVSIVAGVEEWNQRKRQWDFAHVTSAASSDSTVGPINPQE